MADTPVNTLEVVTPGSADTLLGERNGEFKRFSVGPLKQSEQNAKASEVAAAASATTALSARDGAMAVQNLRPDTATAIADVSIPNNGYFSTPGTLPGEAAIIWQKVGGAAVDTSIRIPSKATVDGLQKLIPSIALWHELTVDSAGKPVRGEMKDGSRWEARAGVLTQVAAPPRQVSGHAQYDELAVAGLFKAPGIAITAPTIAMWRNLTVDSTGRIVSGEKVDGSQWQAIGGVLKQTSTPIPGNSTAALIYPTIGPWAEVLLDATGRVIYGTQHDGSVWQASRGALVQVVGSGSAVQGSQAFDFDVASGSALLDAADPASTSSVDLLVIIVGQSWAGGYSYDAGDVTVTTVPQHPGYALKLSAGIEPNGVNAASYVDLCETDRPGTSKETPASGMADVIMRGLQARFGRKPRMIFAISATGGQPYVGLKRGSADYGETLRIVSNCIAISAAQGRKVIVPFIGMWHGEQDFSNGTSRAMYARALDQLVEHYNEDIPRLTGQTAPVRLYVPQMSYRIPLSVGKPSATALAQLDAMRRNPLIRCAGPQYQSPGDDGGGHLKGVGYRMSGSLCGQSVLDDYFGPYAEPLYVLEAWWVSSTVARFRYSKPIAIDLSDSMVVVSTLGAGKGVDFTDGSVTPPAITGIALAAGTTDTLEVTLAGAPAGKRPRFFIAARASDIGGGVSGSGATFGNRSAIRSTTPYFNDALIARDLYHWACQEQIELPPVI